MSDESESVVSAAKPSPQAPTFREGVRYKMVLVETTEGPAARFVASRFTSYLCLECDRPLLLEEETEGDMLCEHCARPGRS